VIYLNCYDGHQAKNRTLIVSKMACNCAGTTGDWRKESLQTLAKNKSVTAPTWCSVAVLHSSEAATGKALSPVAERLKFNSMFSIVRTLLLRLQKFQCG